MEYEPEFISIRHTNSMRKSSRVLISVIVGALVVGCGGLGLNSILPSTGGLTGTTLVGAWKDYSITENGSTVQCPGTIGTGANAASCDSSVTTFNSNGTWTQTSSTGVAEATGTWSITGNALIIVNSSAGTTTTGVLSFSPDNNTYYENINGVTYQASRQ